MRLKEITFHFENCDCLTIDGKYIGNFHVGDIKTVIYRIACNSIRQMDVVHEFAIEIHKDADKSHYPLGIKEYKQSVFDRLTEWDDITSIEFTLVKQREELPQDVKDLVDIGVFDEKTAIETCKRVGSYTQYHETNYSYFVHWSGDSDDINQSQKHYLSKQGHLYIVISEKETIEDYFNKDKIDDKDSMEFTCAMYEIGDKYSK